MSRYANTSTLLDDKRKRRYYAALIDPTIAPNSSDIYVITTIGDRLDLLSFKYYSEASFWWIIAAANPTLRKDSLYLEPGTQLRIPSDFQQVVAQLQSTNTLRY